MSDQGPAEWFNTLAFQAAPIGAYGSSGTGIIQGPALQSYDLSLVKHFAFTERFDLKFQGDFFNAFNLVNFSTLNVITSNTNFGNALGRLSFAQYPTQLEAVFLAKERPAALA